MGWGYSIKQFICIRYTLREILLLFNHINNDGTHGAWIAESGGRTCMHNV